MKVWRVNVIFFYYMRQDFSVNLKLLSLARLVASELQGSTYLHIPQFVLTVAVQMHTNIPAFHMDAGDQARVLMLVQQTLYPLVHLSSSLKLWF